MITINRDTCVICDSDQLEVLGGWQNFPVYMGTSLDYKDIFADQLWGICKRCGGIQLTKVIDSEVLYARSHTPGTVGGTWQRHHEEFSDFVVKQNPGIILEVGAGNMQLASAIYSKSSDWQNPGAYFIMDPNTDRSDAPPGVSVFPYMWSHDIDPENVPAVDTIIHSHTMEHFNYVLKDLKAMADMLSVGGLMCFSTPVIDKFLERGWTNGLNFEHTYLTTIENIEHVVHAAGFEIEEIEWFSDNNVFMACRKEREKATPRVVPQEYERNRELFLAYMNGLVTDARVIGDRLGEIPGPRFIFGAHIFTQTLVYSGLNGAKFLCILDSDVEKQGQRLYGTSLRVESPEVIRNLDEPIVVVRSAQYTEEIVKGLKEVNPSVIVI